MALDAERLLEETKVLEEQEEDNHAILAPLHRIAARYFDVKVHQGSYRRVEFVYHAIHADVGLEGDGDDGGKSADHEGAEGGVESGGEAKEMIDKLADLALLPHLLDGHFVETFKQLGTKAQERARARADRRKRRRRACTR